MRVAVTTPTGNVGRHVVSMLLSAGLRPTVLVRDPSRLDAAVRERVDAVAVDQGDGDAVVAATTDVDALFWVDPPNTADDPVAEYARIGANAARAITENGIAHTVFQSSIGAEKRHGAGEIDGLARTEELLDDTRASVLHLRCGFFFTNLLLQLDAVRAGVLPVVLPVEQPMAWVAPPRHRRSRRTAPGVHHLVRPTRARRARTRRPQLGAGHDGCRPGNGLPPARREDRR